MANKYVSSLASGSGDGSSGSPWTFGQISGAASGDVIYIKADGTYSISSGVTNNADALTLVGYTSGEGDRGTATISVAGGVTALSTSGKTWTLKNLKFVGNNGNGRAFASDQDQPSFGFYRCQFRDFSSFPLRARGGLWYHCLFYNNGQGPDGGDGGGGAAFYECVFDSCYGDQINVRYAGSRGGAVVHCAFVRVPAQGTDKAVIRTDASHFAVTNCLFHAMPSFNGAFIVIGQYSGNGYQPALITGNVFANAGNASHADSAAIRHATTGFTSVPNVVIDTNAFYNCGVQFPVAFTGFNNEGLSVDPFQNASGGDFRINSLPGGGAVVKALARQIPTVPVLPEGDLTAYFDDLGISGPSGGIRTFAI